MKIKNGFEMRDVCGEKVIIAYGCQNLDFSKLINLNESAAYLWEAMQGKDFTAQDMADALCLEYEVSQEKALADSEVLLADWQQQGLVE